MCKQTAVRLAALEIDVQLANLVTLSRGEISVLTYFDSGEMFYVKLEFIGKALGGLAASKDRRDECTVSIARVVSVGPMLKT